MRLALAVVPLLCAAAMGCSSARMAGGEPIIPGDEPPGDQLGLWRTEGCHDAKGEPALDPDAKVRMVRTKSGKVVLVDSRLGYDTVVSDNGELRGTEYVFDVALKRARGQPYLRQYRLPARGDGSGRYVLTAAFEDWEVGKSFHARPTSAALECTLAPARL